jgi:prepilin-type N-terminal cleavage/methylation domain-containing protein
MIWRTSKRIDRRHATRTLKNKSGGPYRRWRARALQAELGNGSFVTNWAFSPGFSLVELLVVLAIVAALSALIGIGVAQAINKANQRDCLTNMIEIEAAKDEYQRDHPSDSTIPSQTAFAPYFRFGIPRCPNNRNRDYQNLLDLYNPVNCAVHTQNQSFLSPSPSPAS